MCVHLSFSSLLLQRSYSIPPDLDRTNLGNARLQGLTDDALHGDPTGKLFDWVNSAYVKRSQAKIFSLSRAVRSFFFSYILVQVPATVYARYFPPRIWIGIM